MDLRLDLVEPESHVPVPVKIAALRVLLAVATSSSPHSKSYFAGSGRALPLLLRVLQGQQVPMATLALNLIWVMAHNHQRALPVLRRLRAGEAIHTAAQALAGLAKPLDDEMPRREPNDAEYIVLMAEQLAIILG